MHRVGAGLVLLAALSVPAAAPRALEIDLGGFAGYHAPIDQDDATDDVILGGRALVELWQGVRLEPALAHYSMDRGPYRVRQVTQEVQTWSILSTTLNARYSPKTDRDRMRPYVSGGAGYYFLRKKESPDSNRFGLQGAVGLELPVRPDIGLDLGAGATRIGLEQGGARGILSLTVGLNFHVRRP